MEINKIHGDIFNYILNNTDNTIILPHVCNSFGGFGAGFVISLTKKFPVVRKKYLDWAKGDLEEDNEFALGNVQFVEVNVNPLIIVANMVAQTLGENRPLKYNMLSKCMDAVTQFCKKYNNPEIHCPAFGSGLARGNPQFIEHLIEDCWLNNNIPVTMYIFP